MKVTPTDYLVAPEETVDLARRPTLADWPESKSKKLLKANVEEMAELQRLLYASNRHALLVIFQGMDTSGKDSAIRHVMSGVNPQGCQIFSFKQPSPEELEHDFLWRTNRCLPERGRIGVFNRSYYEEVLVVRVHPELLANQMLPDRPAKGPSIWQERYRSIVESEAHLHRNGTRIIKIYLHLSREEQSTRFLARIDEPDKNWKFSEADLKESKLWDEYRVAYSECMGATSTPEAPWYVVPADNKKGAHLIISQIILDTLRDLKMSYPEVSKARRKELEALRAKIEGSNR